MENGSKIGIIVVITPKEGGVATVAGPRIPFADAKTDAEAIALAIKAAKRHNRLLGKNVSYIAEE